MLQDVQCANVVRAAPNTENQMAVKGELHIVAYLACKCPQFSALLVSGQCKHLLKRLKVHMEPRGLAAICSRPGVSVY